MRQFLSFSSITRKSRKLRGPDSSPGGVNHTNQEHFRPKFALYLKNFASVSLEITRCCRGSVQTTISPGRETGIGRAGTLLPPTFFMRLPRNAIKTAKRLFVRSQPETGLKLLSVCFLARKNIAANKRSLFFVFILNGFIFVLFFDEIFIGFDSNGFVVYKY